MIETTLQLPEYFKPSGKVDFRLNKKAKWTVKGLSFAAILLLFFVANRFVPLLLLFYDVQGNLLSMISVLLKIGVILFFMIFFGIIHEKLHGYFMGRHSKATVRFGFNGSMAYSASDAYYSKKDYRIILLAPMAIMVVIIFIGTLLLPVDWFWVGYLLQMINLAGSMSDFYTSWQLRNEPLDVLIYDSGLNRQFFVPMSEEELEASEKTKKKTTAKQKQKQKIYGKKRK